MSEEQKIQQSPITRKIKGFTQFIVKSPTKFTLNIVTDIITIFLPIYLVRCLASSPSNDMVGYICLVMAVLDVIYPIFVYFYKSSAKDIRFDNVLTFVGLIFVICFIGKVATIPVLPDYIIGRKYISAFTRLYIMFSFFFAFRLYFVQHCVVLSLKKLELIAVESFFTAIACTMKFYPYFMVIILVILDIFVKYPTSYHCT